MVCMAALYPESVHGGINVAPLAWSTPCSRGLDSRSRRDPALLGSGHDEVLDPLATGYLSGSQDHRLQTLVDEPIDGRNRYRLAVLHTWKQVRNAPQRNQVFSLHIEHVRHSRARRGTCLLLSLIFSPLLRKWTLIAADCAPINETTPGGCPRGSSIPMYSGKHVWFSRASRATAPLSPCGVVRQSIVVYSSGRVLGPAGSRVELMMVTKPELALIGRQSRC